VKIFVVILSWEVKLQSRSLRSRVGVALYLTLCAGPPAAVAYLSRHFPFEPTTYLYHLSLVQPFLTVMLAALLSGYRSSAEELPRMLPVLSSATLGEAGYLLRRWAAVTLLVVTVSVLPLVIAAAVATVATGTWPNADTWFWVWLLKIVPVAVLTSALWLGTVTLFGSELAALGMVFVGNDFLLNTLNEVILKHFEVRVEGAVSWLEWSSFGYAWSIWQYLLGSNGPDYLASVVATEAPYDPWGTVLVQLPRLAFAFSLSALALGLSVAYMRRTRRDLKPRPVRSDHPLRSLLLKLSQVREHMAPAAGLNGVDRLTVTLGVAVMGLTLVGLITSHRHYLGLADERYAVLTEDAIAATSPDVVPGSWRIRASIDLDGGVVSEVHGILVNSGNETRERVAFTVDRGLNLTAVEATARRVVSRRLWDRLELVIDPPLAPGEEVELRWQLRGVPGKLYVPLWGYPRAEFVRKLENFHTARSVADLSDLSRSYVRRAVSRRRVALTMAQLSPVIRYAPWSLSPAQGPSRDVPVENIFRDADIEVELSAPARWFLADVCAQTSRVDGGVSRLRGGCTMSLSEYEIHGGALTPATVGGVVLAVLKLHQGDTTTFHEALAEAIRQSDQAWPGMPGLKNLVVLEELPRFDKGTLRRGRGFYRRSRAHFKLRKQLLLISEGTLTSSSTPKPAELVASSLVRDLMARRRFIDGHRVLYSHLFRALMTRRMGLSHLDARVSGPPWTRALLTQPLLEVAFPDGQETLDVRMPAVAAALEARVGRQRLQGAIDAFLARQDEPSGTSFQQLFTFVEVYTGVALQRFFDDFVAGVAIPVLGFEGVTVKEREGRFEVSGQLHNTGTGEVVCPVFVTSEVGTTKVVVTVGSESRAPFTVSMEIQPHTVVLDPDGNCHRLVNEKSRVGERVDLRELEG
jgi:hypothetical protein